VKGRKGQTVLEIGGVRQAPGARQVRELVLGALLGALAFVIPFAFGFLKVYIPPFSATLCSHVPVMLAILFGPLAAVVAGLGSTLGFLYAMPAFIAARASIHILWGFVGALLYRAGFKLWAALLIVLPIHFIGEALVVVPFGFPLYIPGEPWYKWMATVVGLGTIPHHLVDTAITLVVVAALYATKALPRPRAAGR
jgi:niacin transporter